ncbi:MAG: hypothetical protein WBA89_30285 [Microcoleus sp.]|uniref:hypothetical protein n=1 Tax=Microcoleus sp. TaxID=44472 RepID=UPI003C72E19A
MGIGHWPAQGIGRSEAEGLQQSTVNSQQSVGAVPRVPALLTVNSQQSTVNS